MDWLLSLALKALKPIRGLWRWGGDLIKAPARLRKLEVAASIPADPRPICTGCGQGRVAVTGYDERFGPGQAVGKCQHCGMKWFVNFSGHLLIQPNIEE